MSSRARDLILKRLLTGFLCYSRGQGLHNGKREAKGPGKGQDLLCYWAANELGIPMVELARNLNMTLSAVSYAVKRGEKIAKEEGCQLGDSLILLFRSSSFTIHIHDVPFNHKNIQC